MGSVDRNGKRQWWTHEVVRWFIGGFIIFIINISTAVWAVSAHMSDQRSRVENNTLRSIENTKAIGELAIELRTGRSILLDKISEVKAGQEYMRGTLDQIRRSITKDNGP